MANTRRVLKPYKGFPITKINNVKYVATDPKDGTVLESYSLAGIKERIDGRIGIKKLSKELGRLLLPPR